MERFLGSGVEEARGSAKGFPLYQLIILLVLYQVVVAAFFLFCLPFELFAYFMCTLVCLFKSF